VKKTIARTAGRWPRRMTAVALAGTLWLGACTTAPTAAPRAQYSAQQMEIMRLTMISMMQRDDFVEGSTGVKRGEPVFPAVKSSLGVLYSDPVILEWIVAQMQRDRTAFGREWGRVTARGFHSVDDATAMKLLMPIARAAGRMSESECKAMQERKSSGGADPFMAMLRAMQPHEVSEFFDGMHSAVLAGIRGDAPRPASTPAQIAQALSAGLVVALKSDFRKDNCGDMARTAVMLEQASPQDRTHLLNHALNASGLTLASASSGR
jgi:hypothetical protein